LQVLAKAEIQPQNDQKKDPKLDSVENDTLSPRFAEASVISDYTFRNQDEAGVGQGGVFTLERSLLLADLSPSFRLGLCCCFSNFCHL
jgi:hypothetical protein